MTALPPDMHVLPRLEQIGAKLLRRDGELDGHIRRNEMIDAAIRRGVATAKFLAIADVEKLIAEARAEADRDLDGLYDVGPEMEHLLRALEEVARIAGGLHFTDAARYLRDARKALVRGLVEREERARRLRPWEDAA